MQLPVTIDVEKKLAASNQRMAMCVCAYTYKIFSLIMLFVVLGPSKDTQLIEKNVAY